MRGWGNYFRTGNAADKFRLADSVARRYAVARPHLPEFQRRLWLGSPT
jgi:hypothetical protein